MRLVDQITSNSKIALCPYKNLSYDLGLKQYLKKLSKSQKVFITVHKETLFIYYYTWLKTKYIISTNEKLTEAAERSNNAKNLPTV